MRKKLGFGMCGSFCTHRESLDVMRELAADYDIVPILSFCAASYDTKFGKAEELKKQIMEISGRQPVCSIVEAEKFGPTEPLDCMIICPCTGNTVAKLANGITDTPVTMAAKAHLRGNRPLLIALASNDAMSGNLSNIAVLLQKKHVFFVPMRQDSPISKPHSLVADFSKCRESLEDMTAGNQPRPLFLQ